MRQTALTALTTLIVSVAVVALYHLLFHAAETPSLGDDLLAVKEQDLRARETRDLEDMLRQSEAVVPATLDLGVMGALLEKAGVEADAEERDLLLSLWYGHLQALQQNLRDALAAARSNAPHRGAFRVKATQMVGTFQRKIRENLLTDEQAARLFAVVPAMVPPPPANP